jgi:predicted metalloendopeptidase
MIKLYESTPYRGLPVDGELTLVENISDLGGIHFALDGLRLALHREPNRQEMREFFISFSVSWRSKDRLKRAAELLATDMHAPPMLRVNHVVRQLDEWYEAFNIGPDCEEWIDPKDRIRFFGPMA